MKNSDILKKNMESETNIFTKKLRNVPHSQFWGLKSLEQ